MKEIAHLIKELKAQGIGLEVVGDNLEVSLFKDDVDESIFDQLRARKPEIIAYINSLDVQFSYAPIPTVDLAKSYPISAAQKRIWLANKLNPDPTVYNLSDRLSLPKTTNVEHFKQAIKATIQRHEILRTVFMEEQAGIVRQVILDHSKVKTEIPVETFRGNSEQLEQLLRNEARKPFDLENGPLLRTGILTMENGDYLFYYNMHHIISDGWSKEIMARDVFEFYAANEHGQEAKLPDLEIQYKDYAIWQLNQSNDTEFKKHQTFWTNTLSGSLSTIDFPQAKPRPIIKSNRGKLLSTRIDAQTTEQLMRYVESNGGTLFMGLLAVYNVLIYRYTNTENLIVGTPTAGREHPQLKDQIGFYANTLALRNNVVPTETFNEFFQRVKENTFDSFSHQSYPFDMLVEDLGIEKDTGRNAIFDVMLTLQNVADKMKSVDEHNGVSEEILDFGSSASKFDIELAMEEVGNHLTLQAVFSTDLFDDDFMRQFINHFKSLLREMIQQPNQAINTIDFLTEEDVRQLRENFRGEIIPTTKGKHVLDLFDVQASEIPNEIAVMSCDTDNQRSTLTYQELDELSNQLCHYLHETYTLKSGDLIGLKLERNEWMMVSILAILKAGCAYVPIDLSYPKERIDYMEHTANCAISLDESELQTFREGISRWTKEKKTITIAGNQLAYVIYTSGSTGNPKGVMIEHKNLYHSIHARLNVFPKNQRFLLLSSVAFDSSVAGIFGTLCSGGQLVITPTPSVQTIDQLVDVIINDKITQLIAVPSLYQVLMSKLLGKQNTLKIVIVAGEKCPESLVELHTNSTEFSGCELYNEYGPTEATVWSTYIQYDRKAPFNPTIGKPIENTEIVILNEVGKLQPLGSVGEIVIGGAGVARGYLNDPKLTDEKFVQSKYEPFDRIYRTGDQGKWTKEGELVFLGRVDDQIKIRGYRIQPGEIEQALSKLSAIEQAAVVPVQTENGELQLCAYFVGVANINSSEIAELLKGSLPGYMIPSSFIRVDEMPLTSNGKTDKNALIQLDGDLIATGETYVAPRTPLEERLVEIWKEILAKDTIGIRDNFFSLGGHSLSAIRLIAKIQAEFDVKFEIVKLFEENTIEKIAALISLGSNAHNESDEEMEEFKI